MKTLYESILDIDSTLKKNDFEKEQNDWLVKHSIHRKRKDTSWTISDDGLITIIDPHLTILITNEKIPSYIQFSESYNFVCVQLTEKDLSWCPRIVHGDFKYTYSKTLNDLTGSPEIVEGNFDLTGCSLKSLKGAPEEVGGNFSLFGCRTIKSLKYITKNIKGKVITTGSSITDTSAITGEYMESILDIDSNLESDDILDAIKSWLKEHNIKKYTINNDYTIDVSGDVILDGADFPELPSYINFGIVGGSFFLRKSKIKNLRGCPKVVKYIFNCSHCENLKSLEGAPEESYIFSCSSCNGLTSLEGAPKKVSYDFRCNDCENLKSLEGAPVKVNNFSCQNCNKLKTLKGAPHIIKGSLDCSGCENLESFSNGPMSIEGTTIAWGCTRLNQE